MVKKYILKPFKENRSIREDIQKTLLSENEKKQGKHTPKGGALDYAIDKLEEAIDNLD